ncbi:hypothetical protein ABPG74_022040 [Tetrahymena malaccensis]
MGSTPSTVNYVQLKKYINNLGQNIMKIVPMLTTSYNSISYEIYIDVTKDTINAPFGFFSFIPIEIITQSISNQEQSLIFAGSQSGQLRVSPTYNKQIFQIVFNSTSTKSLDQVVRVYQSFQLGKYFIFTSVINCFSLHTDQLQETIKFSSSNESIYNFFISNPLQILVSYISTEVILRDFKSNNKKFSLKLNSQESLLKKVNGFFLDENTSELFLYGDGLIKISLDLSQQVLISSVKNHIDNYNKCLFPTEIIVCIINNQNMVFFDRTENFLQFQTFILQDQLSGASIVADTVNKQVFVYKSYFEVYSFTGSYLKGISDVQYPIQSLLIYDQHIIVYTQAQIYIYLKGILTYVAFISPSGGNFLGYLYIKSQNLIAYYLSTNQYGQVLLYNLASYQQAGSMTNTYIQNKIGKVIKMMYDDDSQMFNYIDQYGNYQNVLNNAQKTTDQTFVIEEIQQNILDPPKDYQLDFKSNTAFVYNGQRVWRHNYNLFTRPYQRNLASGSGGSIYLNNANYLSIDYKSIIKYSSASIGGAIRIINKDVNLWRQYELNCLMLYNQAEIYGNDIGTFPMIFLVQVQNQENSDYKQIFEGQLDNIQSNTTIQFKEIKSGGLFPFRVQLQDQNKRPFSINQTKYKNNLYEQSVLQELNSYFIQVAINQNAISKNKQNSFIELKGEGLIGIKQYDEDSKMFNFESLTLTSLPLVNISSVVIQFSFGSIGYAQQVSTNISFRSCKVGEILVQSFIQTSAQSNNQNQISLISCSECTSGTYSLVDSSRDYKQYLIENNFQELNAEVCKQCPPQVSFCQGSILNLQDGYWRFNNRTDEILKCNYVNPNICSEQNTTINGCIKGYIGPLCEKCDTIGAVWKQRYAQPFQQYECDQCSDYYVQQIGIIISIFIIMIYLYYSTFFFMKRYIYESRYITQYTRNTPQYNRKRNESMKEYRFNFTNQISKLPIRQKSLSQFDIQMEFNRFISNKEKDQNESQLQVSEYSLKNKDQIKEFSDQFEISDSTSKCFVVLNSNKEINPINSTKEIKVCQFKDTNNNIGCLECTVDSNSNIEKCSLCDKGFTLNQQNNCVYQQCQPWEYLQKNMDNLIDNSNSCVSICGDSQAPSQINRVCQSIQQCTSYYNYPQNTNKGQQIQYIFQDADNSQIYLVYSSFLNIIDQQAGSFVTTIQFPNNFQSISLKKSINQFYVSDKLKLMISYVSTQIIVRDFTKASLKYSLKFAQADSMLKKINGLFLDEVTSELFLYGDGLIKVLNNYVQFQSLMLQDILSNSSVNYDLQNQQIFVYKTYIEVYSFQGLYLNALSDVQYPITTFSVYENHIVIMSSAAIYIYLRGTLSYVSLIQPSGGAFIGSLYIKSQNLIAYYTNTIQYGQILLYSLTTYQQAGFMTNTYQANKIGQVVKMMYDDDSLMFNYIDTFGNFQNVVNNAQKTTDQTFSIEEIQQGILPPPIDYILDFKSNSAFIYNNQRVWRQNYSLFTRPHQRVLSRPANHYFQINSSGKLYFIIADYNDYIYMYQNDQVIFYNYFTQSIQDMRYLQKDTLNRFIFFFKTQILIYNDQSSNFSQENPDQLISDYQFKRVLFQEADKLIINTADNFIVDYDFFIQKLNFKFQLNPLEDIISSLEIGSPQSSKWQFIYGTDKGRVLVYNLITLQLSEIQFTQNNNPIFKIKMYNQNDFICLDNIGNVIMVDGTSFQQYNNQPIQQSIILITQQIYGKSTQKNIQLIEFDMINQKIFINFQSERFILVLSLIDYSLVTYLSFPDNEWKQIVKNDIYLLLCSSYQINVYTLNNFSFIGYSRRYNRKDRITDIRLIDQNKVIVVFVNRIESLFIQVQTKQIVLVDSFQLIDSKLIYLNIISQQRLVNYIGVAQNTIFEKNINYGLYESNYQVQQNAQNGNCYIKLPYNNYISSLASYLTFQNPSTITIKNWQSVYIQNYINNMNFLNQNSQNIILRPQYQSSKKLYIDQSSFQSIKFDLQMDSFEFILDDKQIIQTNNESQNIIFQNIAIKDQNFTNVQLQFQQKQNVIFENLTISNINLTQNRRLQTQNQQAISKQYFFNFTSCQNVIINNLIIKNVTISIENYSLIYFMGTNQITIRNLSIQNCVLSSLIEIFQSKNVTIQNVQISNCNNNVFGQNDYLFKLIGVISQQIQFFQAKDNKNIQFILTDKQYSQQNLGNVMLSIDSLDLSQVSLQSNTFPSNLDENNIQNISILIKNSVLKINYMTYEKNEGNIQFLANDQITIQNSNFLNNKGVNGGCMYAESVQEIFQIYNSTFISNYASGSGGSIYLKNVNQFNIDSKSQLKYNNASIGGAIRIINSDINLWYSYKINSLLLYNYAELHGNNIGTLPTQFLVEIFDVDQQNYQKIYNGHLDMLYDNTAINFQNVQSGGLLHFRIQLLDHYSRPLSVNQTKFINNIYEKSTMLELNSYYIQVAINQNLVKINNQNQNIELKGEQLIGIQQYDANSKMFNFESLTLTSLPLITVSSVIIQFSFNNFGFSQQIKTTMSFRSCYQGEILVSSSIQVNDNISKANEVQLISCVECSQGKYSLSDPAKDYQTYLQEKNMQIIDSQICKQCPPFVSNCYSNTLILQDGYWRTSNQTDQILECNFINPDICSVRENTINGCITGYIGPICEKCDSTGQIWGERYVQSFKQYQCDKCSSQAYQYIVMISMIAVVYLYLYFSTFMFMGRYIYESKCTYLRYMKILPFSKSCIQDESSYYIKILLNYLQLSSILFSFYLKFIPSIITTAPSFAGSPSTKVIINTQCLFSTQTIERYGEEKIMIVGQSLFPLITIIFFYLVLSILKYFKVQNVKDHHKYTMFNVVFLFFQPDCIFFFTKALSCTQIGSQKYQALNILLQCDDESYKKFSFGYVIPNLAFWILIPAIQFYKLKKLKGINNENLDQCIIKYKYGLFYSEYKPQFYFWEIIRMYLKIILILITNILNQYEEQVSQICIIIVFWYIMVIIKIQPFKSKSLQKIEFIQYLTLIPCIFFFSLYRQYSQTIYQSSHIMEEGLFQHNQNKIRKLQQKFGYNLYQNTLLLLRGVLSCLQYGCLECINDYQGLEVCSQCSQEFTLNKQGICIYSLCENWEYLQLHLDENNQIQKRCVSICGENENANVVKRVCESTYQCTNSFSYPQNTNNGQQINYIYYEADSKLIYLAYSTFINILNQDSGSFVTQISFPQGVQVITLTQNRLFLINTNTKQILDWTPSQASFKNLTTINQGYVKIQSKIYLLSATGLIIYTSYNDDNSIMYFNYISKEQSQAFYQINLIFPQQAVAYFEDFILLQNTLNQKVKIFNLGQSSNDQNQISLLWRAHIVLFDVLQPLSYTTLTYEAYYTLNQDPINIPYGAFTYTPAQIVTTSITNNAQSLIFTGTLAGQIRVAPTYNKQAFQIIFNSISSNPIDQIKKVYQSFILGKYFIFTSVITCFDLHTDMFIETINFSTNIESISQFYVSDQLQILVSYISTEIIIRDFKQSNLKYQLKLSDSSSLLKKINGLYLDEVGQILFLYGDGLLKISLKLDEQILISSRNTLNVDNFQQCLFSTQIIVCIINQKNLVYYDCQRNYLLFQQVVLQDLLNGASITFDLTNQQVFVYKTYIEVYSFQGSFLNGISNVQYPIVTFSVYDKHIVILTSAAMYIYLRASLTYMALISPAGGAFVGSLYIQSQNLICYYTNQVLYGQILLFSLTTYQQAGFMTNNYQYNKIGQVVKMMYDDDSQMFNYIDIYGNFQNVLNNASKTNDQTFSIEEIQSGILPSPIDYILDFKSNSAFIYNNQRVWRQNYNMFTRPYQRIISRPSNLYFQISSSGKLYFIIADYSNNIYMYQNNQFTFYSYFSQNILDMRYLQKDTLNRFIFFFKTQILIYNDQSSNFSQENPDQLISDYQFKRVLFQEADKLIINTADNFIVDYDFFIQKLNFKFQLNPLEDIISSLEIGSPQSSKWQFIYGTDKGRVLVYNLITLQLSEIQFTQNNNPIFKIKMYNQNDFICLDNIGNVIMVDGTSFKQYNNQPIYQSIMLITQQLYGKSTQKNIQLIEFDMINQKIFINFQSERFILVLSLIDYSLVTYLSFPDNEWKQIVKNDIYLLLCSSYQINVYTLNNFSFIGYSRRYNRKDRITDIRLIDQNKVIVVFVNRIESLFIQVQTKQIVLVDSFQLVDSKLIYLNMISQQRLVNYVGVAQNTVFEKNINYGQYENNYSVLQNSQNNTCYIQLNYKSYIQSVASFSYFQNPSSNSLQYITSVYVGDRLNNINFLNQNNQTVILRPQNQSSNILYINELSFETIGFDLLMDNFYLIISDQQVIQTNQLTQNILMQNITIKDQILASNTQFQFNQKNYITLENIKLNNITFTQKNQSLPITKQYLLNFTNCQNLIINNLIISNLLVNTANYGIVYTIGTSNVTIKNLIVQNSFINSFIDVFQSQNVIIQNIQIGNCFKDIIDQSKYLIQLIGVVSQSIKNFQAFNNKNIQLLLTDKEFQQKNGSFILSIDTLNLTASQFFNNTFPATQDQKNTQNQLIFIKTSTVSISQFNYEMNKGNIQLITNNKISITSSIFQNNIGVQGGCLYMEGVLEIILLQNTTFYSNQVSGSGGSIYLNNVNQFIIDNQSEIKYSNASIGGAIRIVNNNINLWKSYKINCLMQQNFAEIYGNNIGTLPLLFKVQQLIYNNKVKEQNYLQVYYGQLDNLKDDILIRFNNVQSGGLLIFRIQLLDHYERPIYVNQTKYKNNMYEQQTMDELNSYFIQMAIAENNTHQNYYNQYIELKGESLIGIKQYDEAFKMFNFESLTLTSLPLISINSVKIQFAFNTVKYTKQVDTQISFRSCQQGEILVSSNLQITNDQATAQNINLISCQECSQGKYSLSNPEEDYQQYIAKNDIQIINSQSTFMYMEKYIHECKCTYLRLLKILPFSKSCILDQSSDYIKILFLPPLFSFIPSAAGQPSTNIVVSTQCIFTPQIIEKYGEEKIMIIIQSLFPLITLLIFYLTLKIFWALKIKGVRYYHQYTMFNVLFLFFQPNSLSFFTKALSCRKIGDQKFQIINILINCDDEQYRSFSFGYVIPNLLFWSLVPAIQFYFMKKQIGKNSQNFDSCITKFKYGVYYVEYKPKYYYWDIYRIYLKIIVIIITTILNEFEDQVSQICMIIIFAYIFTVVKVQPFKSRSLLKLEYLSYSVLIPSVFLFQLYRQYSQQIFQVILAIIHYFYICFMVLFIIKFKLQNYQSKFSTVVKYLCEKMSFKQISGLYCVQKKKQSGRVLMLWRKVYNSLIRIRLQNVNNNFLKIKNNIFNASSPQSKLLKLKDQEKIYEQIQEINLNSLIQINKVKDDKFNFTNRLTLCQTRKHNKDKQESILNKKNIFNDSQSFKQESQSQILSDQKIYQGEIKESIYQTDLDINSSQQQCFAVFSVKSEINQLKKTKEIQKLSHKGGYLNKLQLVQNSISLDND